MKRILASTLVAVVIASRPILVIPQISPVQKLTFDVASVKPSPPGFDVRTSIRGGRFVGMNVSFKRLVMIAYGSRNAELLNDQIIGGPSWIDTEKFDVEAQTDLKEGSVSYEKTLIRLQSLLEERFQLEARRDQKELQVYNLVVARQGLLKLSSNQTPPDSDDSGPGSATSPTRGVPTVSGSPSGMVIGGNAVRISAFANLLGTMLRRRVVDKTNLTGLFDIHVPLLPASAAMIPETAGLSPTAADPSGTSVFTVPVEQLGLRLDLTKASVAVVVIESVQRPSPN